MSNISLQILTIFTNVLLLSIGVFFFGIGIRQLLRLFQGYGIKNIYSLRRYVGFKIRSDLDYTKAPKLIYKIQLLIEILLFFALSAVVYLLFYQNMFNNKYMENVFNLISIFLLIFSASAFLYWCIGAFRLYMRGWGIANWSNQLVEPNKTTSQEKLGLLIYGIGSSVLVLIFIAVLITIMKDF